jgi:uncharacterized protein (DUF4213/DUF364 family)
MRSVSGKEEKGGYKMIMAKVLQSARPYLKDRYLKDLVVGISLLAVELDNGEVGVSYVLRSALPQGCSAFPYAQELIGKPALEIADWAVTGKDNLQRAIASATLGAASSALDLPADKGKGLPFGLVAGENDTVGMIGLLPPVAEKLTKVVKKLIVFDEGVSLHGDKSKVYPLDRQKDLLPTCEAVILSGTTTINKSIDSLLGMCTKAREIVMYGPSTPMFPEGFKESRITRLAGAQWDKNYKEEIFKGISRACGVSYLSQYMFKKVVAV